MSLDPERRRFYPLPTESVIQSVLERYEKSDRCAEEKRIISFFRQLPFNKSKNDVLLKATALKSFMGNPSLHLPFITHYILSEKNFDSKLQRGVKSIVDGITASSRAKWKYASFARQYCAFHKPEFYLGAGWSLALVMYERLYHFMQGERFPTTIRYAEYTKPFRIFRDFYGLAQYSLLDLQHFLQQLYRDESEYTAHYHADELSQRCSRNALILDFIAQSKDGCRP